ncbi:MAG TPA: efflux RND transporter periplasmic adaptor subunit [Gemmataceae bacterium]|nr:efflux RND transporter periplasmic adaptor subunit [Gemmataceae bacterium]
MRYLILLLLGGPAMVGCGPAPAQQPSAVPPPPEVLASLPVTREITDYVDFPGRIEAVNSIDVRARVTGYLDKVYFQEGADVKQGDLLFEIDPRPYKADLARAEGNIVQCEGRLRRMEADYQRAADLLPKHAIGREDFDRIAGDRTEAVGALAVAKAQRDMAELNVGFTQVRAPLSGRISRRYLDPGNLVKADETTLTTIVSLDPIYAYFDADERTTLRLQRLVRTQKIRWSLDAGLPVLLGLADEEGFPRKGTINFADNRLDPDTGTWRLRALCANSDFALSPGMFVRMRAPVGEQYRATLISEQALGTDQGQKFVYVVNEKNKVEYRRVKVGALHGGLRVIIENLSATEKVVVSGLQRVRPDLEVRPKVVEMPGVDHQATGSPGR